MENKYKKITLDIKSEECKKSPLTVLPPVVDVLEEGRPDDAERVEEAHRKAEEQRRAQAVGQHHRHRVQAPAFLFVSAGSN